MSRRPQVTLRRVSASQPNERIVDVHLIPPIGSPPQAYPARITLAIAVLPDGTLVIDPYGAEGRVIVRLGEMRLDPRTGAPVE